jgi:hypothetical protein
MKRLTERQLREEAIVRHAVRRAIARGIAMAEAKGNAERDDDYDTTHDEFGYPKENPDEKRRKNSMVGDVGGAELQDIASQLGFSISGAKQAVDKAMKKAQFLASLEDPERDEMVLHAIKDYIEELEGAIDASDPEAPTAEDIQLMYDNPSMVAELDGFREFLHSYVKRLAKAKGQKIS